MPTASTERPTLAELKLAIAARSTRGHHATTSAGAITMAAGATQGELFATTSSGWPEVDALLGGGLPRGRLSEIVGLRSSGKTSLALASAARATSAQQLVAWVDGPGELYPPVAAAQGVDLERLLIVKSGGKQEDAGLAAARAGEIVARSRAFGLVVLDVSERAGFPERAASRLRAAAHEAGIAVVALVERRGALPHAHCQLEVRALGGDAANRRFEVALVRGGAQPGAKVVVAQGAPARACFRDPQVTFELQQAAQAIRPLPWRATR
jgi:hypothetical protein